MILGWDSPVRFSMTDRREEKWWAHEDSNPGQTDYEAVELRAF
jgi:hypothetical protein|tara:strand:- start:378 stop:506 length:129 start_codon:yes stop_codon:yes gene_type:complete